MKLISIVLFFSLVFIHAKTNAQGCVAIRSNGNTCSLGKPGEAKGWQFNLNTRYFKSYKHFVGKEEQHERVENGTEVINHSLSWDFTFTKALDNRWSVAFNLPLISNVRSSMYEHYGNNNSSKAGARRNTESFGIGDFRVAAYRWLLNPEKSHNGNIQAGLGIKLPTGDYKYQDYFHKLSPAGADSAVMGPVDQSIQLGDGGTGFTVELNGFYNFFTQAKFVRQFLLPHQSKRTKRHFYSKRWSCISYQPKIFHKYDECTGSIYGERRRKLYGQQVQLFRRHPHRSHSIQ